MALTSAQITNFNTMLRAAQDGDLALVECRRSRDGAITAALCAVAYNGEGICLTPLAEIVADDALAMYEPPSSASGFERSQALISVVGSCPNA
jgi:hypothetical protein